MQCKSPVVTSSWQERLTNPASSLCLGRFNVDWTGCVGSDTDSVQCIFQFQ